MIRYSGGEEGIERERFLPGGFPAGRLLPEYPFVELGDELGGGRGIQVMSDGGLCVPIVNGNVVAGLLTLWGKGGKEGGDGWSEEDKEKARQVATTIALAASLEGRWQAVDKENGERLKVIQQIRNVITVAVHQARSPITALILFGKLLLKKLPPGDGVRELAKSIVVTSQRLDNIMMLLEGNPKRGSMALKQVQLFNLPQGSDDKTDGEDGSGSGNNDNGNGSMVGDNKVEIVNKDESIELGNGNRKQLFWISEMILPILESTKALCEVKNIEMTWYINEDIPPIVARPSELTESINNLLDNSLKYTPRFGTISVQVDSWEDLVEVIVTDTGVGIPEEERELVCRPGYRGSKSEGIPGSGLGLALVQQFVVGAGGEISIESPQSELETADGEEFPGTAISLSIPRARMQE